MRANLSEPTGESLPRFDPRKLWLFAALLLLLLAAHLCLNATSWAQPFQHGLRQTIMLQGHVSLQGRPTPPDSHWVTPLQLVLSGAGLYSSTTVTTDALGFFSFPEVISGTYDITVKGPHTLRVRLNAVSLTATSAPVEFGTLKEGDINNDNVVNALDASILATAYWKTTNSPGFVPQADLNDDGIIDARDASLLATNYWQSGAPPIVP